MIHISTVRELAGCVRKCDLWKQITDFNNYPKLIPQIDSIRIIDEGLRKSRIEWFITLDGAPFSWVESDTLEREHYTLSFEAISGDFDIYRGDFRIEDIVPDNSLRLTGSLSFKLGIPVIEEHCGDILRDKFQRFLETIVEKHSTAARECAVDERRFKRVRVDRPHSFSIDGRIIEAKIHDFSSGGMALNLTKGMLGTERQRPVEFRIFSIKTHGLINYDERYQLHRIRFDSPLDDASSRELFARWTDGGRLPDATIAIYDVLTAPVAVSARSFIKKTTR